MDRRIRTLRRYLERGPEPGCTPFDRYAYNTFSWQARWFIIHGKTEQDRAEAKRLCDLACKKSNELAETGIKMGSKLTDVQIDKILAGGAEDIDFPGEGRHLIKTLVERASSNQECGNALAWLVLKTAKSISSVSPEFAQAYDASAWMRAFISEMDEKGKNFSMPEDERLREPLSAILKVEQGRAEAAQRKQKAIALDRERLGKLVRDVWVECACEEENPKPGHLIPWEELDARNKEIDRRIGVRVAQEVLALLGIHEEKPIEQG